MRAAILTFAAFLASHSFAQAQDEPRLKGKTFLEWVDLQSKLTFAVDDDLEKLMEIDDALRELALTADKAIPILIERMKDPLSLQAGQAGFALSRIGFKAIPPLVRALEGNHPALRVEAARTLGQMRVGDKELTVPLRKLLKSGGAEERIVAAAALAELEDVDKEVIDVLAAGLQDRIHRFTAAQGVGKLGLLAKPLVPTVIAMLGGDANAQRAAVEAVRGLGPVAKDAVPPMVSIIEKTADEFERQSALWALQRVGPDAKAAAPTLLKMLRSTDKYTRQSAMTCLGAIGADDKEMIDALRRMVREDEPSNASSAAFQLGQLKQAAKAALPDLVDAAGRGKPQITANVLDALHHLGAEPNLAWPIIRRGLKDDSPRVRGAAARALAHLEPNAEALTTLTALLGDKKTSVVEAACASLRQIGPRAKDTAPALTKALAHSDPMVQVAAAGALGAIGSAPDAALAVLVKYAQGKLHGPRLNAVEQLGRLGPKAKNAVGTLVDALKIDDPDTRLSAAVAHWKVTGSGEVALPIVQAGLKSRLASTREWALNELGNLDPTPAKVRALVAPFVNDRDEMVRSTALRLLKKIDGAK